MELVVVVLVIFAMLLGNALYVAAEFATVSASRPKLNAQSEDGIADADYVEATVEDEARMDRYIACAQVGITFTSLVIGFYGQRALTPYIAPLAEPWLPSGLTAVSIAAPLILIALTMLQVIFGELFPKSIAVRNPEGVAILMARPMRWSLIVLRPFITLLNGSANLIMARLGLDKPKETGEEHTNQELLQLITDSMAGGALERPAHEMLRQVLAFQERTVREVMVPRTGVKMLSADLPAAEALSHALATPYTRLPLTEDRHGDRPAGFVHVRELHDLVQARPDAPVSTIARPLQVFPDSLTLGEAWERLQGDNATLALVFDEYGGIAGLISVEDLVEEIIGEVVDEFDEEEPRVRREKDRVVLRGDLSVSEINRRFLLELPEDRGDSISGLVAVMLGVEEAEPGKTVTIADVALTVQSVENGVPRLVSMPRGGEGPQTEAAA